MSTTPADFQALKAPPPALIELVAKRAVAHQKEQAAAGIEIMIHQAVQQVLESDPEVAQAVEKARQSQPLLDDAQIRNQTHDRLTVAEAKRQTQDMGRRIASYQEGMKRAGVYVSTAQALRHIQAMDRGQAPAWPDGADPQAVAAVAASYREEQARQGREITTAAAVDQVLRGLV